MNMPPLGIEPRYMWEERRIKLLYAAIKRYEDEGFPYPPEWLSEHNELRERALVREALLIYLRGGIND